MKNLLVLIIAVAPTAALLAAADAPRPNILYFYVDDMGWGSIGPNAQAQRRAKNQPSVRTPNIDRLAAAGVNFSRGYACTVCSPSRASQQTGFHQGHAFSDRNDPNNARKAIRRDDVSMGDALSAVGYKTGYWGKWGYGGSKEQVNPTIDNVQTLPTSHGFQHVLAELHHVRAHTFFQPTLWNAPATAGAVGGLELVPNSMTPFQNDSAYPDTPALQNEGAYPKSAYCDDSYAFAALDFVRAGGTDYNKTGKPFFGLLAVQIPHAPFGEVAKLPDWDKAYAEDPHYASLADQSRQWAAMVTRIDAHFGNILSALEDPNNDGNTQDSIAKDTLVIFQSDNGGPSGNNNVELDANGGLRGNKGQIYEGGIRVPLVMRWPARINTTSALQAGTQSPKVVDITDLLPTFCELAGAETPLGVDGVSIAPTLLGDGYQRQRDFVIHEAGNRQSIICGKHKLIRSGKSSLQLFDLGADRAEANDIADKHPKLAKHLEALLLGERVAEPKGFANTYHHWTGSKGGKTSDADNWSDYEYSNAGVTYMTETGAPQLSWTARIVNSNSKPNTAHGDIDLEFLALEVRGSTAGAQSLVLGKGVNLTGRNEVRIAAKGRLVVDGGQVDSLRWVETYSGGTLSGSGRINSTVYNSGVVDVTNADSSGFDVSGDYRQTTSGKIRIAVGNNQPALRVAGTVVLNGTLEVSAGESLSLKSGSSHAVIRGKSITGRFNDPSDQVKLADGTQLTIRYLETAVTVVAD